MKWKRNTGFDQIEDRILITRIAELDLEPVGLFQTLAIFAVKKLLD